MVDITDIHRQLTKVGYNLKLWGRAEVKELCRVLVPDETISHATNGHYEGGFALLVATDKRLILIDRKPLFLTLDTISYSMIQEVALNYRLLNSTIRVYTSNKCLVFNTWNHSRIRSILMYTQQHVAQAKQQQNNQGLYDQQPLQGDNVWVSGPNSSIEDAAPAVTAYNPPVEDQTKKPRVMSAREEYRKVLKKYGSTALGSLIAS